MPSEKFAIPTDPEHFAWSDAFLVGFAQIDETHREFVDVVRALLDATPAQLVQRVQAFIDHAKKHFGEEDTLMRETNFPAADCHIDEHAQVMKSAYEVLALAEKGDAATTRRFAEELTRWFPGHADYLDSALAAWMVKRSHGGKPVVLRRQIA